MLSARANFSRGARWGGRSRTKRQRVKMGASVSDLNAPAKDALTVLSKHTKVPPEELLTLSAAELHAHALKIDMDVFALAERADKMGIPEADVEKAVEGSHGAGAVLELMLRKVREEMEAERNAGLRGELDSMSVLALGKKARACPGVTKEQVNEAMKEKDKKAAIIALIIKASAAGAEPEPAPAPASSEKKIIVMSCPEMGTISPYGEG
eukprot:COSAG04_NODE_4766_length_1904_cov_1.118006_1_plen_209_part_01